MKSTAKAVVQRDAGHPWDPQTRPHFDLLHVSADNDADMDAMIELAGKKFWHPWLLGRDGEAGLPKCVLFKPCGIMQEWEDSPKNRHPGCPRYPVSEAKEVEESVPSKPARHRP